MIGKIVDGLVAGGKLYALGSAVVGGVQLGRAAFEAATGAETVSGHEEETSGGYPLIYRADPMHWITPTPGEWQLKRALEAQGRPSAEVRATVKESRRQRKALEKGGDEANQAAAEARDMAEAAERQRRAAAMVAARAGDTPRARAEARAAIMARRFRALSAALTRRAQVEPEAQRAAALYAQAAATAQLALAPPAAADAPQASDPFSIHVRRLLSAVASRAGDKAEELADRIQQGALTDDEGEELTAAEALELVSGEEAEALGAADDVAGCGCAGPPVTETPHTLAGLTAGAELLAAFQTMGASSATDGADGADEPPPPAEERGLADTLASWGTAPELANGADEKEEPEGFAELLAVFQGAAPRPPRRARVAALPARPRRGGGCSSGSCPV